MQIAFVGLGCSWVFFFRARESGFDDIQSAVFRRSAKTIRTDLCGTKGRQWKNVIEF